MKKRAPAKKDTAAWIRDCIFEFVASAENDLHLSGSREPAWEDPLVGFSRGDDPLYQQLKKDIGPFLWTPPEIFAATFPGVEAAPEELTVISWILPQTKQTRLDNRREKALPADRWILSRWYGEDFNARLRDHVAGFLKAAGYEAVAPANSPRFQWEKSERYGLASSWSERHVAYTSGLGTFGLCDGLITPRGKAMRCGSVVARIDVPPSERPYEDRHAYCLFYFNGKCGKCMQRCPAGAITPKGRDKEMCYAYSHTVTGKHVLSRFGLKTSPCGLCQTGVPCEAKIPIPRKIG